MHGLRSLARALACGLALASCAGQGGGSSSDKPLVISQQVADHFEKYKAEIAAGRSGAFAVTESGTSAFYSVCDHGNCHGQYSFGSEALKGCQKYGRGRCVLLATNSVVKRSYTVGDSLASLLAQLPPGKPDEFVSGDRIRQRLVGNSIVEKDVDGRIWAEYFDPDGTLRGRTSDGRTFGGTWKITGDTLCVDYRAIARDWCGQFADGSDGSFDYYRDGKFRKSYSPAVLQQGNPQNL
jgi:hypothetical protein